MSDTGGYATVKELVDQGILERPMDGNHGEIHPKGDDFVATGVPFITAADIKDGRVDVHGCAFIREKQAKSLRKGFAKLGDVLLTHKATIGRTAIVDEIPNGMDWIVLTPQVTYYRVLRKDVLEPRYLKFYFDSPAFQALLESWSGGGSTRAYLGITNQLDLPIPVLPIDKQRDIAAVLGSLDDKIEQNRRTGRALEGLARATFNAWFVDFEPVKAKAAGAAGFPGMPVAAFAALPDRLADSSIGPVPDGWDVRPLAEAFDINPPRRLSKGEDAPYLDMKNMPTDGHAPDAWERRPHGSGMRFMNGDTLVARITPCLENGKTAYVDFLNDGEVAWGSTEYIVLRPKPPLPEVYAYCLARTPEFRDFAIQNMTGTSGRQRVAASALEHYHVAIPDAATAAAFGDVARPLFKCIRAGKAESSKLADLRDYLLPRLLSGQVRIGLKEAQ